MNRFRNIRGTQIQGGSTIEPNVIIKSITGSEAYLGSKSGNDNNRWVWIRQNKNSSFVNTDGGVSEIVFYKDKLYGFQKDNNRSFVYEAGIWNLIPNSDYKQAQLATQLENFVPESPVKKIALIGGIAVAGLIFWKKILPMIKSKK